MDDAQQRRVAENEATCRRINEGIETGLWEREKGSSGTDFVCECGRPDCHGVVHLTLRDYERVRHGGPRWFMLYPGHEDLELERVVDAHSDYLVVEKKDEAGRVAEAEDPRG